MVTLNATNNDDGTATLTVTGSTGGNVVLYWSEFETGITVFALLQTVVGNASVVLPLLDGYYLFYAVDGTDVSPVVGTPVTGGGIAVLTEIRIAMAAVINGLGLGLAGGVVEQWRPNEINVTFPCVVLTHENTVPTRDQKFVGTTDIGYAVRVLICDRTDKYDGTNMPRYDLWRQRIGLAFDGQRLFGVRDVMICQVEDDVYSDNPDNAYEFMVSNLVIRAVARQPVGIP